MLNPYAPSPLKKFEALMAAGKYKEALEFAEIMGLSASSVAVAQTALDYINEDDTVKDNPTTCDDHSGKWMCEGYGQYDQIGTQKHIRRESNWHVAFGKTKELATKAWKNQVQSAAPPGFSARHIKKKCKKLSKYLAFFKVLI